MDKYDTHEMEYKEWTSEEIVQDDLELIADCDAILVHWLEVPTCGTPMEVFFANYFPMLAETIENLSEELVKRSSRAETDKKLFIREACEDAGVPFWVYQVLIALNDEVPVAVQTRVPPEEISPWLTEHANVIVETFGEAAHWIENNVNDGNVPEPDVLEPKYDLVSA